MSIPNPLVVTICGGGNGAHVFSTYAATRPGVTVNVLTLYKDEYTRWSRTMTVENPDGSVTKGDLNIVTNDPSAVLPASDLVIFVVPSFAHLQYLEATKPHLKPGCCLGALPGEGGFDLACRHVLGKELASSVKLFAMETLPWACRIEEYGRVVQNLGTKNSVDLTVSPATARDSVKETLQMLLGDAPKLQLTGSFLGVTLMNINSVWHPTITYGQYRDWDGVTPFQEAPLFYEGADAFTGEMLTAISDEILQIVDVVHKTYPQTDLSVVKPVRQWMLNSYGDQIGDKSSLYRMLNTNAGYIGLCHPMKPAADGDGFLPNFGARYLAEDIPYGLVVTRGIAELFGVETPKMDQVILWAQQVTGKEYLVQGKVAGKDVVSGTRSPQAFGFKSAQEFMEQNGYDKDVAVM